MESGQRIAIARRSRTALTHACHVMDAGCGWLRRLAVARKSTRLPKAAFRPLSDQAGRWQRLSSITRVS
jgi:hypothetical protein